MTAMIPVLCALLSGAAFYIATGLGGSVGPQPGVLWLVALIAPIPVLWFAFRPSKSWVAFVVAFAALSIGDCNILPAYWGTLPAVALLQGIFIPALAFALAVLGARFVMQRVAPISGAFVFACLWTTIDYLLAFGPNGTALSVAYSQVEMPLMIQSASIFGLWSITFVMGFFAASAAMFAATRQVIFAALAIGICVLNMGYGQWRITSAPQTPVARVGLAADFDLVPTGLKADEASALKAAKAYGEAVRTLANQNANLIVVPEKIFVLKPEWRGTVNAEFETAAHIGHATIIVGADERVAKRQNSALVFFPNGAPPQTYIKRKLVPGLESAFAPGNRSFMILDHTGVAICKDMDFPAMLRQDALLAPDLYAVPAWDFVHDATWHARLAIMRGVENGFSVARAANDGLLTLSDAYGRVLSKKESLSGGMVLLRGDLPRGPGRTLYADVGDAFAWIAAAMSVLLLGVAFLAKPGYRDRR